MGGKGLIPKCSIAGYILERVAAKRAEREADFAGITASRGSRGGTPGCLSFFTYTKPPVCVDFGRRLSSPVTLFFCPFYPAPWTTVLFITAEMVVAQRDVRFGCDRKILNCGKAY